MRGGGGEGEDREGDDKQDTLKATNHQKRGHSSPPGIGCKEEEGEETDSFDAAAATSLGVQLRNKRHISRSMDALKVRVILLQGETR